MHNRPVSCAIRAASLLLVLLSGCQRDAGDDVASAPDADVVPVETQAAPAPVEAPVPTPGPDAVAAFQWPPSLRALGDGYPTAGDPCRRLGETAATAAYLDDSATLVGCPGVPRDPAVWAIIADGGKMVGSADGVTLISVPMDDADPGM